MAEATNAADASNAWDGVVSGMMAEMEHWRVSLSGETHAADTDVDVHRTWFLPDPGEEARQAIAQSLRESAGFRQILGPTVGLRDQADPDARDADERGALIADAFNPSDASAGLLRGGKNDNDAAGGRSVGGRARPAAQRQTPPGARPDEMLDASLVRDDGPTLRTVLRSFVRVRQGEPRQRSSTVAQSVADAAGDASDDGLSLGERLLDSRMLGDAVRAVVAQPGFYDGDNSLSVLGHGRFEMELDLSTDAAGVTVSEISSGAAVSMPLDTKPLSADEPASRPQTRDKVDIYQLISSFMQTTTGMALTIITTVMLAWLGMFKFVMWLNR